MIQALSMSSQFFLWLVCWFYCSPRGGDGGGGHKPIVVNRFFSLLVEQSSNHSIVSALSSKLAKFMDKHRSHVDKLEQQHLNSFKKVLFRQKCSMKVWWWWGVIAKRAEQKKKIHSLLPQNSNRIEGEPIQFHVPLIWFNTSREPHAANLDMFQCTLFLLPFDAASNGSFNVRSISQWDTSVPKVEKNDDLTVTFSWGGVECNIAFLCYPLTSIFGHWGRQGIIEIDHPNINCLQCVIRCHVPKRIWLIEFVWNGERMRERERW